LHNAGVNRAGAPRLPGIQPVSLSPPRCFRRRWPLSRVPTCVSCPKVWDSTERRLASRRERGLSLFAFVSAGAAGAERL